MVKATINGIQLSYTDQGQGTPLVFIHAFPLSSAMWEPQVKEFSKKYRVITLDLRGHGDSDAPLWHFTLDDFAEDIRELLRHLGITQATFVGLSMGGYTLFALFRKYPELVTRMVLADTRAQADSDEAKAGRFAMAQVAYQKGPQAIAEMMMPKLLGPTSLEKRQDIVEQIRSMINKNQASGIIVALMAMAQRPDSTPLLSNISCPTLVIVGENDVATPPAEAHYIKDRIPIAQLVILPQAGHLSNLEQPDAFNQALISFFKKLEGQEKE
jgi:3-oxoadipate enol-lactonase